MENLDNKVRISASSMMWSMDIDVTVVSSKRISLKLVENGVSSRTEEAEWEFTDPTYDLFSQIGLFLLDSGDWRISGLVPVFVLPESKIDGEFLSVCWCASEFESVGRLLALVNTEQRESIYELFDGFKNQNLQAISEPFLESLGLYGEWEEITDRFGTPDGLEWWKRNADELKQELINEKDKKARHEAESLEKEFGNPELVGNLEALINKYGDKIPAEFLLHVTKFPPPDAGLISDALLLAWGRLKSPMPRGKGPLYAQVGGIGVGDGDLAFAHWLLKNKKIEKLNRIRTEDSLAKATFKKLRSIADDGKSRLKKMPTSQAEALGVGIAKMKTYLDPDTE